MYTKSGTMLIVRLPVSSKTQTVLQNNNKKRSKFFVVLRAKTVQNGKQNKQYAMQLIADITTIVLRAADVDGPAEG